MQIELKNNIKEEFKKRIFSYIIHLVKFLGAMPKDPVTREITGQLVRSGTSVGANYFEAQSASSRKDYQNYFNHSLKSANESAFWLTIMLESDLIASEGILEARWLLKETKELASIFASSILTLKGKK
jgi:four helix bundle protein